MVVDLIDILVFWTKHCALIEILDIANIVPKIRVDLGNEVVNVGIGRHDHLGWKCDGGGDSMVWGWARNRSFSDLKKPVCKTSLFLNIGSVDISEKTHVDGKMKVLDMVPEWRSFKAGPNSVFSASLLDDRRNLSKVATKDHELSSKGTVFVLRVHSLHQVFESAIYSLKNMPMSHRSFIPDNDLGLDEEMGSW